MIRQLSCVAAALLASLVATVHSASAHPHVWVTMRSELVYAPDGTITGIRHAWTFDDMFSAFATQGIDTKQRGAFTREELEPLAKTNIESLKDFEYFTMARANGKRADFVDPPAGYYLEYKDQILTLHFTLPFKTPVKAKDLRIDIYDPEFFVNFDFAEKEPVKLTGAPAACTVAIIKPNDNKFNAQRLDKSFTESNVNEGMGALYASKIAVKCP